ncbi:hypothetical protein JTM04_34125, partial [Pseudomonas aeruginosa]|nr:hypothetical protein [Pseudomonas aeruginosa]
QATIPMIAAVSRVAKVHYAEIVASIASQSAGPGTRANIDEFTETTSQAIEKVGGAGKGKAIIVLNPAEPPLMMRDTVYILSELASQEAIAASIAEMAAAGLQVISDHTKAIISFALCGFANLSSIAILIGGLGGMAPNRRQDIAQLGLRAVAAGTLSNL